MTPLFRKQLLIAILPVLLLAALSTLWTTEVSEKHMIGQLEHVLAVESDLHAAGVRGFLDERIAEMRAVAASPITRSGDQEKTLAYLRSETARLQHHFEGLYLDDLQGNVIGPQGEKFNVANRDYFPRLLKGEIIITDVLPSRATTHKIILIIVPFYDENNVHRGAIGGSVQVAMLNARVESVVSPEEGFATLVDSQGKVLTPLSPTAKDRRAGFAEWLKAGHPASNTQTIPSHTTHQARLAGVDYFIAHHPVKDTGWQFYLAKRVGLAAEPAITLRWTNVLFSALVLVVASIIAWYSTGRLLKPLGELVEVHRRFGQGDYEARVVRQSNDEIGELGRAFNQTAELLAQRQAAQKQAERQLRDSEARLRLLSENVDDAVYLHDLEGNVADANHAACASLGYDLDTLLKHKVTDFVVAPDESEMRQVWRTIHQRQEKVRRLEVRHRRRDGSEYPVEMSAVPLQTARGPRILVSARDISDRRRAEAQMTNFFRLSEDMMCIADEQGVFREMSPAFEQVLGYKLDEMIGKPILEFVHPDDRERTLDESRKIFDGRGSVNFENRYRCKDGTYKWLQWRPFREVYEGMIYAIARDVTESHRMSRLMQQTSMAARIGGWEYDFITGKLFWTEETYRLHDLSPDTYEPISDSALQFYVPESRVLFQKTVERAMEDGKPWSLELEMITAQGRMIWVHVLGRVDFEHGKPVRTYGSFQDITERKAAELERRALDNQLLEMQRVESIGILAGGIAHDFNNLLTGVLGFTRLAAAEAEASGSETIRSHLQQIEECSLRAADLCKQLLAYAGKGQFALETIDVSELVRDTSSLVESIVGSNARLEFDLADHLPLVEGDPTQLRQVVMNLVTNAFDALGQQDGTVRVRTGQQQFSQATLQTARARGDLPPGYHVFLEVSDTGSGMSEEVVTRIFDPFFTTKFAGRGLGLAAVQGIVRTHRGAILVTSAAGQGTTFTVVLPAADDPEAQPPVIAHTAEAVADSRAASGGTVILIDDEAAVLSLARTALERGGFKVLTAKDGPSGLETFAANRQEVVCVIVDMTMPGMNGLEVLRALRAADDRIPLLSMSGYTEKSLDAATAELNLAGFVEKPFRLGDLVAAVQSALAH